MMMMRWCAVQTNEYDLQAKMYPNICTHHKLHNNNDVFYTFTVLKIIRNIYMSAIQVTFDPYGHFS